MRYNNQTATPNGRMRSAANVASVTVRRRMIVTAILLPLSTRSGLSSSDLMSPFGTSCPDTLSGSKVEYDLFYGLLRRNFNDLYQNRTPGSLCAFPRDVCDGGARESVLPGNEPFSDDKEMPA